jgi:hypothetical protein
VPATIPISGLLSCSLAKTSAVEVVPAIYILNVVFLESGNDITTRNSKYMTMPYVTNADLEDAEIEEVELNSAE